MSCASCEQPGWVANRQTPLGTDKHFADISLWQCEDCFTHWLHYHYELEAIARSGRWARGALPFGVEPTAATAADVLAQLDWYFAGGSYFDGVVHKRHGSLL